MAVNIENKVVRPALVGGLRVYVDGQARRNWPEMFGALDLSDLTDTHVSIVNGIVIYSWPNRASFISRFAPRMTNAKPVHV